MSTGTASLDALLRDVRAAPPRAGATRVVAIDGRSGSGKTTLAGGLAAALEAPVVPLQLLYPGWDGLEAVVPQVVTWVLEPLAAGRGPRFRRFDWVRQEYAEWHDVPPAPVLVLEGVGSGALACAPYLSTLIWLEAPAAERKHRALSRDGDTYAPHWDRWAAQEEAYLAREDPRGRADVVLTTASQPVSRPEV